MPARPGPDAVSPNSSALRTDRGPDRPSADRRALPYDQFPGEGAELDLWQSPTIIARLGMPGSASEPIPIPTTL